MFVITIVVVVLALAAFVGVIALLGVTIRDLERHAETLRCPMGHATEAECAHARAANRWGHR